MGRAIDKKVQLAITEIAAIVATIIAVIIAKK